MKGQKIAVTGKGGSGKTAITAIMIRLLSEHSTDQIRAIDADSSVSLAYALGMDVHKTEIFGPVVVILKADSLDEAIDIINKHQYGNGASIYTQSGYYARKFKLETGCGMIGGTLLSLGRKPPALPCSACSAAMRSETSPLNENSIIPSSP